MKSQNRIETMVEALMAREAYDRATNKAYAVAWAADPAKLDHALAFARSAQRTHAADAVRTRWDVELDDHQIAEIKAHARRMVKVEARIVESLEALRGAL